MFELSDIRLEMLQAGGGTSHGAWNSRKTVPYIIFAQCYVGNYELTAGSDYAMLEPGEAFFTAPDIPLDIDHHPDPESDDVTIRFIHFNLSIWGSIGLERMFELPLRVERDVCEQMAPLIDELRTIQRQNDFASAVKKNRLGYACLELLLPLLKPRPNMERFVRYSDRIIPVLEFIDEHITEKLPLDEIITKSKMSRGSVYQLFKQALDISPHQYIIRQRLNLVAEKLRTSDNTLAEIADDLGYPNQFLLSRQFKQAYGISPQQYRQTKAWKYGG